jgi:hypothetical protein
MNPLMTGLSPFVGESGSWVHDGIAHLFARACWRGAPWGPAGPTAARGGQVKVSKDRLAPRDQSESRGPPAGPSGPAEGDEILAGFVCASGATEGAPVRLCRDGPKRGRRGQELGAGVMK